MAWQECQLEEGLQVPVLPSLLLRGIRYHRRAPRMALEVIQETQEIPTELTPQEMVEVLEVPLEETVVTALQVKSIIRIESCNTPMCS